MVDVDGSCQFSAYSQPTSIGSVWGLAATRRSVYIHRMNRVNSRNDFGHDDSNTVLLLLLLLLTRVRELDFWIHAFQWEYSQRTNWLSTNRPGFAYAANRGVEADAPDQWTRFVTGSTCSR